MTSRRRTAARNRRLAARWQRLADQKATRTQTRRTDPPPPEPVQDDTAEEPTE